MEKHKCKLCFKSFSNGRALGGHMRSHLLRLPVPPKQEDRFPHIELSEEDEEEEDSESTSSSEEEEAGEAGEEGEEKGVLYGLRENPKRSIRLVDPEFSFAAAVAVDAAGSIVVQDRESETESSKNPTRRRSKRTRRLLEHREHQYHHHRRPPSQEEEDNNNTVMKKVEFKKMSNLPKGGESSWGHEPEPVSSISDTTTEEDVAFCLMMLSRDKWKRKAQENQEEEEQLQVLEDHEEAEAETDDDSDDHHHFKSSKPKSTRGKYKCETCNKVFKSYQALGGHRASHKKLKVYTPSKESNLEPTGNAGRANSTSLTEKKIHECPYCFRVFSSGQALGGHKRSHVTGLAAASSTTPAARSSTKLGDKNNNNNNNLGLIDLNLPAPADDDDLSQVDQLSAVSDAEFANYYIKR